MKNLCLISGIILILSGCGGGGSGGSKGPGPVVDDGFPPNIHIHGLGLQGGLDENATVTVNSTADNDAINDNAFSVLIPMGDDGIPDDPIAGDNASGSLDMSAIDGAGNTTAYEVDFTLYH